MSTNRNKLIKFMHSYQIPQTKIIPQNYSPHDYAVFITAAVSVVDLEQSFAKENITTNETNL